MSRKEFSHRLRQVLAGTPIVPEPERVWTLRPEVLIGPNTPKPLHELAPRNLLGREWWDKTRREAYRSTQYHCIACGVASVKALFYQWLEGHEIYQIDYKKGIATYIETVPLCHACHNFIHDGRLKSLLEIGQCSAEKYKTIMDRGNAILKEHGLKRVPYIGPTAKWEKWRLVLHGRLYSPKFASYEAWEAYFKKRNKR